MSNKVQQTKGWLSLRGKIFGLDSKDPYENDYKRSLGFGIKTSKDNTIFVQVGEWLNSKMTVKLKGEGMEETVDVSEQDAIDEIKGLFKDGDSVFVGFRVEVDTYKKKLKFLLNKIYIMDNELDFDSDNFKEVNDLDMFAIATDVIKDNKQKVAFATYRGDIIEQDLKVCDEEIEEYLKENIEAGDLVKLNMKVERRPIYEEVGNSSNDSTTNKERRTLKGKKIGGNKGNKKVKIKGYDESLIITDIDIDKIEKSKYSLDDLGLIETHQEDEEMPF